MLSMRENYVNDFVYLISGPIPHALCTSDSKRLAMRLHVKAPSTILEPC